MGAIWVYAEHQNGSLRRVTYELLGKAAELAAQKGVETGALVLGEGVAGIAEELGSFVDKVYLLEDPLLKSYNSDAFVEALLPLVERERPSVLLAGATTQGRDLFPALAGRLGVGAVVDCVKMEVREEGLVLTRPLYGGKVLAEVILKGEPQVVLVRPRAFPPADSGAKKGEVLREEVRVDPAKLRIEVLEVQRAEGGKVDLTEADVIVCGGRGLKAPENFKILEELAEVLGGVVGATRAVVDAGWRPQTQQVGKSGRTVSPNLYFAIGLSGAIHHVMGMDTSKVVVAINRDPMAPIFQYADYGLVADLFQVVPLLTEELKKELGK